MKKKKKIVEITWNWSPACMESNNDKIDCYSDTCESAKVSDINVIEIKKHKSHFDIEYANGKFKAIFNPNTVTYIKK